MNKGIKTVFLDRDGTINAESRGPDNPKGFMWDMRDLYLIPDVAFGIKMLNDIGYLVIGITNQSGIARELFTEEFVKNVHEMINVMLSRADAHVDDWYFCPHHPTEGCDKYRKICDCRKPKPGMIFSAAEKYNINLSESYLIGDSIRDIECAWNAGVKPILVLTGNGKTTLSSLSENQKNRIEYISDDLFDACTYIHYQQ